MARSGEILLDNLFNKAIEKDLIPTKFPNTRIGILFSVIAAEMEAWEIVLDNFQSECFLVTALTNDAIERLAEPFYKRVPAKPPYVYLKFYWDPEYQDEKTDTIIPFGTVVSTDTNPPIEYQTVERTILYKTAEYTLVKAVALEPGENQNVDSYDISIIHEQLDGIKVVNPEPSWGGREEQPLTEVKTNALNFRYYLTKGTKEHLELVLHEYGLERNRYNIIEWAFGYGSFAIAIKTESEDELLELENIIMDEKAEGVYFQCVKANGIPIAIKGEFHFERGKDFTPEEYHMTKNSIMEEIYNYIEKYPLGENFHINELTRYLLNIYEDKKLYDIVFDITTPAYYVGDQIFINGFSYLYIKDLEIKLKASR
jgi:hypothetical protein